jgi:hypothetical protein
LARGLAPGIIPNGILMYLPFVLGTPENQKKEKTEIKKLTKI